MATRKTVFIKPKTVTRTIPETEISTTTKSAAMTKEDEAKLDNQLLASRDTHLYDSDDDSVSILDDTKLKEMVGSKAKLRALMSKTGFDRDEKTADDSLDRADDTERTDYSDDADQPDDSQNYRQYRMSKYKNKRSDRTHRSDQGSQSPSDTTEENAEDPADTVDITDVEDATEIDPSIAETYTNDNDVDDLDDVDDVDSLPDSKIRPGAGIRLQGKLKTMPKRTIIKSKNKKPPKLTIAKRGPGRPPKTQKKEPLPRRGIQRLPQYPESFVEIVYDQPVIMKKIFSFFKSVAASEIQMIFRPSEIIFYAVDHNEKTKIRVRVDASKLNCYYCRDVLDVGIAQKEMEMILNKVDKDYGSIVLLSEISTMRRNLTLVFDNDIQIDELHRIDLIASYRKMENEMAFIDEDYMISFTFPGKYFKKTIGDIKSMSSQLSITQEDNESPLIFEYLTENKRIQSKHTVKDSNKIKLISNLRDGETFRVDVCIDYLKPISSAQLADEITILVDENKALMTKAYIDGGTIEIKTLTEIIDERPEEDDPDS